MKDKLPKNLNQIVYEYLLPKNEYLITDDMAVMSVLMQASRFLCWNRIPVQGQRGLEPCSLYALNFAPSGGGKDVSIDDVANLNTKAFIEMARAKRGEYDARKQKLINTSQDKGVRKMNDKQFKKELWWHNTYSGGTIQGMYLERAKMSESDFGSLHFESSEFLDKMKNKTGDNVPIFTYMKEAYASGNTKTDSIMGEMRDNIDGIPMTMYLHGSSMGLKEDGELLSGFLNIFGTGIARRSFCLFSNEKHAKEYTEQETLDMMYQSEKGFKESEKIMYKSFDAVFYQDSGLFIDGYSNIFSKMLIYKNKCKRRWSQINNEILAPEVKDRFWKALRLAACIALIEHPESLKITEEDYDLAEYLCERWGQQFEDFIKKQIEHSHTVLYEFIKNSDSVNKTQIRSALNYGNDTRKLNADIETVKEMAIDNNMEFTEKNGERGRSVYYSLVPLHLIDVDEYNKNQKGLTSVDISKIDI